MYLFHWFAVSFKNGQSGFDNNSHYGKDTASAIGSILESQQKVATVTIQFILNPLSPKSDQHLSSPCSITSL